MQVGYKNHYFLPVSVLSTLRPLSVINTVPPDCGKLVILTVSVSGGVC